MPPRSTGSQHDGQLPGIDPREVEEVGREPRETLNLPLHRLDEAAARLLVEVLVREQLEEAADREQRGTQLVRRVRDELLARVVELRELHAHAVERARELADLVVAVIDDRRVEVAAGDPLRGRLESEQAVREHSGSRQAEDQREHERERRREQEALADDLDRRERVGERRLEEHDRLGPDRHGDLRVVLARDDHPLLLEVTRRERRERDRIGLRRPASSSCASRRRPTSACWFFESTPKATTRAFVSTW